MNSENKALKNSRIVNIVALIGFVFALCSLVFAATPNPGHPWDQVGDGIVAFYSSSSVFRGYTLPAVDAIILTTADIVQGSIIYGSGASTTALLQKSASSTRYLANTGPSNNPAWDTINLSNGVSGILSALNGGTESAFFKVAGPTSTTQYTFPFGTSTVYTTSSSSIVAFSNGGTGSSTLSSGVMVSNGSSISSLPIASTTGNSIIVATGTTWESKKLAKWYNFFSNIADKSNNTTASANTTNITYLIYLGVAQKDFTSCIMRQQVTTALTGTTWAEVGIGIGENEVGNPIGIRRAGTVNVATTYNTTGLKSTVIPVSIEAGDTIWAMYGSQATTRFNLRAGLADTVGTGLFRIVTGQPSTWVGAQNSTVDTTTAPAITGVSCR